MNWTQLSRSLSLVLALSIPTLKAADVTITVNGEVVAKPCTVSTLNATVDLGNLQTFDFVSPGSTSIWHDISLSLTNCPVGTSQVTASFSGTADETGYYKNLGTADNIQLELQDGQGTILNTGEKTIIQVNDFTKTVSFPLKVRALSVQGRVTQGTIQTVISVTYTYS